jgi:hypothetical protein
MVSFLGNATGLKASLMDLRSSEQDLHLLCIVVTDCYEAVFRCELVTLLCLKSSSNNVLTYVTNC